MNMAAQGSDIGSNPEDTTIHQLSDVYKRQELVNQKLANEISDEEISAYYEKNKELFHTEQPFVKGLFIKFRCV